MHELVPGSNQTCSLLVADVLSAAALEIAPIALRVPPADSKHSRPGVPLWQVCREPNCRNSDAQLAWIVLLEMHQ